MGNWYSRKRIKESTNLSVIFNRTINNIIRVLVLPPNDGNVGVFFNIILNYTLIEWRLCHTTNFIHTHLSRVVNLATNRMFPRINWILVDDPNQFVLQPKRNQTPLINIVFAQRESLTQGLQRDPVVHLGVGANNFTQQRAPFILVEGHVLPAIHGERRIL